MDATSILIWIVIGIVAGWLASIVVGGAGSLIGYLIAGLIGSIVGGFLAGRMGWRLNLGNAIVEQIVISFIGAIIVLLIVRLIRWSGMDGVGVLGWIVIGLVAGWIAEKVTGSRHGILANLAVGLVGAIVGGLIFNAFGTRPATFLANLVVATIGSVIFLFLWSMIRGRR